MENIISTLFGLCGGLALFLYGMSTMSDALQRTAGSRMRGLIAALTRNPVLGALAGAFVTAVLQSSSATTVMVIGFVSAGLMTLPQAISVIFGANVGTTMTAQLLAFNISEYIYPILFFGFLLYFAGKKEKTKSLGLAIFSFGLLFEGIEIMGSVMEPLANSPFFIHLMLQVKNIPVFGVLLGTLMTLVVQSSSATIAVLQSFASQLGSDGNSVIGLSGAIPILLGDNIGTTITAALAAFGQNRNAKRTALAHTLFNVSGSILFLFFLPQFVDLVQAISPAGKDVVVVSRQIANAHTLFNIICTLIWLPLIDIMLKIVKHVIPNGGNEKEIPKALKLEDSMLNQPTAAIVLLGKELGRCAEVCGNLMQIVEERLLPGNRSVQHFHEVAEVFHMLQDNLVNYIARFFNHGGLSEKQASQAAGLLSVSDYFSRIADRCEEINEILKRTNREGHELSEGASQDLVKCYGIAKETFEFALNSLQGHTSSLQEKMAKEKIIMRSTVEKAYNRHLERIRLKQADASFSAEYSRLLYDIERIVDDCHNIVEEESHRAKWELENHPMSEDYPN